MKKLFVIYLLTSPVILHADWLDDLASAYDKAGTFEKEKALETMEAYLRKSEVKRFELKKDVRKEENSGVLPAVRSGSYQAEIVLLDRKIEYYKKVVRFIRNFSKNKEQEKSFAQSLHKLGRRIKRLNELKVRYSKSSETVDKIKLGANIAFKEAQIASYKVYIKNILI